jgi:hypothetical protein
MMLDEAATLAATCHCQGWNFAARGVCLEAMKRYPDSSQLMGILRMTELELAKQPPCESRIFVFGDSHAESFDGPKSIFEVVFLGARTMYGVGHGGLDGMDPRNFGVANGDCIAFVFGEIDVRLHIGRIRDRDGRALEDVLEDLVASYIGAIMRLRGAFADLDCLVASVVPPIGLDRCPGIPQFFYGDTFDRLEITLRLNLRLEEECRRNAIGFVDRYTPFADPDGLLDVAYADNVWHVRKEFHQMSRAALLAARDELRARS